MTAILSARGLVRRFGGLTAVQDVDLEVRTGEILGIIGPNGAGKTTLFNLLAGALRPTSGRVALEGRNIVGLRPHQVNRLGLARTFQLVRPFRRLSVIENVMVGAFRFSSDRAGAEREAREILAFLELEPLANRTAHALTTPEMKKLEVARALATNPRLLLLDEVMSGLTPTESRAFIPVVRRIRERGVTILMIEHVLRAVMALSDRIVVLHHGHKLAEGTPAEIAVHPEVLEAYLGTAPVPARG